MFAGNVSLDLLDAKMKVVDIDHCIQRYEGFKRIGFTPNQGSICAEPAENARDAGPCRVCSGKSFCELLEFTYALSYIRLASCCVSWPSCLEQVLVVKSSAWCLNPGRDTDNCP